MRRALFCVLGILAGVARGAAQGEAEALPPELELGAALERWADAFDAGDIAPTGDFRRELDVYGALVEAGGLLLRYRVSDVASTHRQMLERMVEAAEREGSVAAAHGLLAIGGLGLEQGDYVGDLPVLRDLASTALIRMMTASVDVTDEVVAAAGGTEAGEWSASIPQRVAALRALGTADDHDRRDALRRAVQYGDPRVRLAAAEAVGRRANVDTLDALVEAIVPETHPVVAQAIVQAAGRTLDRNFTELSAAEVQQVSDVLSQRLGTIGWRADIDIVALVGRHPSRDAIPRLIDVLDPRAVRRMRTRDRDFAPVLRERAWQALRRATGTLLPIDDVGAWRDFWEREGARLELRSRPDAAPVGSTTTGGFFGIEVSGRRTAFVLDASRSMSKHIDASGRGATRFDIAARQLLTVAQDMPRRWQFQVFTFTDDVVAWNPKAARADERTMRSLTAFLTTQVPRGRSDLGRALEVALGAERLRFGVEVQDQVDELFVLSDGMPADVNGPVDVDALLARVRELNRYQKVRIHTVMAGEGSGAEFLRRLAAENGGEFVQR